MKRTPLIALAVGMTLPLAPSAASAAGPDGSCGLGAWLMDRQSALDHAGEHGFATEQVDGAFAAFDRNRDGFLCASYGPTSSPLGRLGYLNLTDDAAQTGIVSYRFTKSAPPSSLAFAGTYDGATRGAMSSVVEIVGVTTTALRIEVTWTFGATVVEQTGTLSLKDGDVLLRGVVTAGPYEGRRAVDTGHVGPNGTYLGVMSILPG